MGTSAIVVNGVQTRAVPHGWAWCGKTWTTGFETVLPEGTPPSWNRSGRTEEYIDYLNKELASYISHIIVYETNERTQPDQRVL